MTHATQTALATLRDAGFFIVAWNQDEMEGVSESDREAMENMLIEKGNEFIDTFAEGLDDEAPMCTACNGSGEGMYDGSRCSSCGGKGVEQAEVEAEFDE